MNNFKIPNFEEFQSLKWHEMLLFFRENPTVEKTEYHRLLAGKIRPFI